MSARKTRSEFSAGGVVYRITKAGYEIAIIHRARHTDWSLPKGHIEQGETREQAALREVKEETGLDARIVGDIGEIVYFYRRPGGDLVRKSVYHYLMEAQSKAFGGPNSEVQESRWIPISEADALLSYDNDKGVVSKAAALLEVGSEGNN